MQSNELESIKNNLRRLVILHSGKKRNDVAIVIPSADSVELLEKHLSILSGQDYKNFDVIIIGKAPKKISLSLNILFYDELCPLGSSGGFGIGQVLAYSLGYEFVINSDVDATPISKNLVRRLVEISKSSGKSVFPKSVQYVGCPIYGYIINQYGICPRALFDEFGFIYFRLFKGSEDVDYCERLAMEGRLIRDDSILVRHKSHLFDFISLLKSQGNKYIYYKKSEMLVQILLSSYSIRHFRPLKATKYFFAAFLSAIKTQFFYSQYIDIWHPVLCQAMHLDMSKASPARSTRISEVQKAKNSIKLSILGEKCESSVVFAADGNRLAAIKSTLKAIFSSGDYFLPTKGFTHYHASLYPILLLAKPLKYSDGKVYSSGLSQFQVALNFIKTMFLIPYFIFSISFSVLKAFELDYPITRKNLDKNLSLFWEYSKQLKTKAKK